jgi:transposase-like protein
VARPSKHPVDVKLKIVLSVVSGESTQAEAARRHGVSEQDQDIPL